MEQGILLAGGNGTRLKPLTKAINKHFLSVYDKPLIYYSLTTMILAGVQRLVLISKSNDLEFFRNLVGDGSQWGLEIILAKQDNPNGIPEALSIAASILNTQKNVILALGDNILYGSGVGRYLSGNEEMNHQANILCFPVSNPCDFGVININSSGKITDLEEKPSNPRSNLAITGFYRLPSDAFKLVNTLEKSKRGEFEIVDLLRIYLYEDRLKYKILPRGTTWLDAGTAEGITASADFVRIIQERQGVLVCSPDEAAWRIGNIDSNKLETIAKENIQSSYGKMLFNLLDNSR